MNYMKQVAQMLGVELGEEFKVECYNGKYKIIDTGIYFFDEEDNLWYSAWSMASVLLRGNFQIIKLPKPILDEKEKEYLSYIIRPFRSEIISIYKQRSDSHRNEWININFKNDIEMVFPSFRSGTMYKGMELDKKYTLEELGL